MSNPVQESFDVVVIGGGPGGSSAGAYLARHGLRVLILEREHFPRFHIGESLLPAGWDLWEKLGVTKAVEEAGFVLKQGIMFGMFEKPEVKLLTAEYPQYFVHPWTFHVERAKFDELLLNNARAQGAEAREGWTVSEVIFEGDRAVGVLAGPEGSPPHRIEAPMVVDATGRDCMIARRMGWRRPDPVLNKIAHFTHFKGAFRRDSKDVVDIGPVFEGSVTTDIYTIDGGWIWYIPLADDIVSVGAVLDARHAKTLGDSPQERFERAVAASPTVQKMVGESAQQMEMQTISNISYLNEQFVGDGFVLVGDASMFVDPIFSAGVTLAIRSGIYASECILDCFKHQDFRAERLRPYETRIKHPMQAIFKMIYNWYSILERKDSNNIISRARQIPLLRERFIVMLSGGYDRMDLERILVAAGESPDNMSHSTLAEHAPAGS
jgi:halogenation protein CepH